MPVDPMVVVHRVLVVAPPREQLEHLVVAHQVLGLVLALHPVLVPLLAVTQDQALPRLRVLGRVRRLVEVWEPHSVGHHQSPVAHHPLVASPASWWVGSQQLSALK